MERKGETTLQGSQKREPFGSLFCVWQTASGMRSHATPKKCYGRYIKMMIQYRKRYEVTCDEYMEDRKMDDMRFQYRKRYEVTCDVVCRTVGKHKTRRFNTASGMRSHATLEESNVRVLNTLVSIPQAV